ncbi:radial spoke head 14 homolog [Microcebus murinus]|uniref:Radial spoke head 14 homolog n=1 Tax=Microcebus murinus TaxID=30608 RepID=A0A8B7WT87_MICMU|nr:radial spoke head 14 homolog [Microcebus murinus]XP_020138513.1 radial spoke head 14 homolog [Microcebus murinus]XP_020138514.1 radial spoke head 14 homolog [Microcebus murinus]
MAEARISMYLPPDINPTKAAIAYGCRALPKLNEELQSEVLTTRQKALMALCDLMHDPEYVYQAIDIGCLDSLKALLKDINDLVRIKATEVLCIMATHNVGRDGFLEHGIIPALSYLLDDANSICRENLHKAYKHLAQLPSGAQGIVSSGLIPSLVWKLQKEQGAVQELILDTLAYCLQEDATEALGSRVVPFLKQLLLSASDTIRAKAACTLMAVSIPLQGKNQVWEYGVIPILVHLLKDDMDEVQANAAGALTYAAVTTEGKYAALEAEAIDPLLDLLCSPVNKVRLNATKALTMLAEAPEGRRDLQSQVHIFRTLQEETTEVSTRRAAQIAIKVIEWKP